MEKEDNKFMIAIIFIVTALLTLGFFQSVSADTEFRGMDYLDIDHGDLTHTWEGGLPEFIDDNGTFVNSVITENSTHITMNSRTPIIVDKINCQVSVYEPNKLGLELQTVLDFRIDESDLIPTSFDKFPNQGFTKVCIASQFTNSTGSFINHTKTWTDATNTFSLVNIIALFENEVLPESFHEISYNGTDTGKQYAFFIESRTMNIDSINFDLSNYKILGSQINHTDPNDNITIFDDEVIIEVSSISNPVFELLNPNLDSDMVFDLTDAQTQLQNVEIKADQNELTIEVRFYVAAGIELFSGDKLFLDPTFGFTAGGENGVRTASSVSTSCGAGQTNQAGGLRRGNSLLNEYCQRTSWGWFITSIPDSATIDDVDVRADYVVTTNGVDCDWDVLASAPDADPATRYTQIASGTALGQFLACNTAGTYVDNIIDLGATADTELEADLAGDTFYVGIAYDLTNRDPATYTVTFSEMSLRVEYTEHEFDVTIDLFEDDEITQILIGEILQENSTNTRTETLVSGDALFTAIDSLNNFTAKETTDNLVINKTLNYDVDADQTLSLIELARTVNCASNGASDDLTIRVNDTDYSYISSFTTPVCDSEDIVTWQVTAMPTGQSLRSPNATSIMVTEVLTTTDFGNEPQYFRVNGTTIATNYDEPKITSSPFNFSNGIKEVVLDFVMLLDSAPTGGGGSPGGGGGGGESSSIFEYNLLGNTHLIGFNSGTTGEITIDWDSGEDLTINDIIVDRTNIDSIDIQFTKIFPFNLEWKLGQQRTTEIVGYSLTIPPNKCSNPDDLLDFDSISSNCAFERTYEIPVEVVINENSVGINKPTIITVTVSSTAGNPLLPIVGLLGLFGLGMFGIYKARSRTRN